jgi:CheY-like chemotaxis protein
MAASRGTETIKPKHVLACVRDLMLSVRLADVMAALGYQLQLADTAEQLAAGLAAGPDLVLLDLSLVERWEATVRAAKDDPRTAPIPMLAFGAHLDVAAQQRGRAAGVDRVVANSKFMADLPSLVATLVS